jgi:NAD(P)-dependent dehydrogenase (short-subunit alcohol dehydrogenase family)
MSHDFSGRTVVVTGAARGMGRSITDVLLRREQKSSYGAVIGPRWPRQQGRLAGAPSQSRAT